MYLEISGRQTGKTSRLIEHASDYLQNNPTHRIGIVSPNFDSCKRIENQILENCGGDYRNNIKKVTSVMDLRGYIFNYVYFDEFSYIHTRNTHLIEETISNLMPENHQNQYYCTTPNGFEIGATTLLDYFRQRGFQIQSYDVSNEFRNDPMYQFEVNLFDDWCIHHELEMYPHPFNRGVTFGVKFIKKHRF